MQDSCQILVFQRAAGSLSGCQKYVPIPVGYADRHIVRIGQDSVQNTLHLPTVFPYIDSEILCAAVPVHFGQILDSRLRRPPDDRLLGAFRVATYHTAEYQKKHEEAAKQKTGKSGHILGEYAAEHQDNSSNL